MKKLLSIIIVLMLFVVPLWASANEITEMDNYYELDIDAYGDEVTALQTRLSELGYDVGMVNGKYGKKTMLAVCDFQLRIGMFDTGIADKLTQYVLYRIPINARYVIDNESMTYHMPSCEYARYVDGINLGYCIDNIQTIAAAGYDACLFCEPYDVILPEVFAVEETKNVTADVGSSGNSNTAGAREYVLNKNTKKFHYPYCSSVDQMKEKNRWDYEGTREDVINMGYVPCKNCDP